MELPAGVSQGGLWAFLSQLCGWTYFFLWSISFYPQIWSNWKRKSVRGLSLDFAAYNVLGFLCYSAFMMYVYPEDARLSDVFFAVHAFAMCVIIAWQCTIYDRGGQVVSPVTWPTTVSVSVITLGGAMLIITVPNALLSWRKLLLFLSFVKLAVTAFKYIPQVYLNYKRQSTEGWSIWLVLLDFYGGILCLVQMLIDGFSTGDWAQVYGNPVKLLLSLLSIAFDIIFTLQHYVFYPGKSGEYDAESGKPLISRGSV